MEAGARSWAQAKAFFGVMVCPNDEGERALTYFFLLVLCRSNVARHGATSSHLQPRRKIVRVSHILAVVNAKDGGLEDHGVSSSSHTVPARPEDVMSM